MPRLDDEVAFGVGALLTTRPQQMSPSQLDGSSCPSGPGSAPSKRSLTNGLGLCQPELPFMPVSSIRVQAVHPDPAGHPHGAPQSRQRIANG